MNDEDRRIPGRYADDPADELFDLVDADLAECTDAQINERLQSTLHALGCAPDEPPGAVAECLPALTGATQPNGAGVEAAEYFWALADELAVPRPEDIWQDAGLYFLRGPVVRPGHADPTIERIYDEARRAARQIVVDAYLEAQRILNDANSGAQRALREAYRSAHQITDNARSRQHRNGGPGCPVADSWAR